MGGQTIADNEVKVQEPGGKIITDYERYATFDETPFPGKIKDALKKAGFPAPSQVQQYCWPLAMKDKDVIGVAATGSGKTLSFLLPAFAAIIEAKTSASTPTLCVLAPTRELAIQIEEEAKKFGEPMIQSVCCYGGAPKGGQANKIRWGVHAVIGTPGRINDFLESWQLDLSKVNKLVLDEADRMLDMGFEPQIRKIFEHMPAKRHTMFYSATWPASVRRMANEFLCKAYTVTIGNRDELKGNQDITQSILTCRGKEKNSVVLDILRKAGVADPNNANAKGLVFCSTKRMCDQLVQNLEHQGVPCAAVHGDKSQRDREWALGALKQGSMKLLVATDVAARGLDIKGVTLVINYDPAGNTEDYVHRIGRTGRAGNKGHAIALIAEKDTHALWGILEVMKRTNQNVTREIQELAKNAPPTWRQAKGPPQGQIDPNFKSGLNTGSPGAAPALPEGAVSGMPPANGASMGRGRGGGMGRGHGGRGGGDGDRRDRSRSRG